MRSPAEKPKRSAGGTWAGLSLLLILLPFDRAAAYTILADGQSLTWNISSAAALSIRENGPCIKAGTTHTCNYILSDPPFGQETFLSATITPQNVPAGRTPQIWHAYTDDLGNSHLLGWKGCVNGCTLEVADSFFLPGSLRQVQMVYESDTASDPDKTKIFIQIEMAYYDPATARLHGGPDINRDTAYCGSGTTPPLDRRGAGPGD